MTTIVTRSGKGSALTHTEMDANFNNLNSAKYESGNSPTFTNAYIGGYIYHSGDTNTYIRFVAADDFQIVVGGRQILRCDEGTDPDKIQFYNSSNYINTSGNMAISGSFTASGDVTAYSDVRLKTNIQTIDGALDKVKQLRGVSFEKNDKQNIGVIAQEVEAVIPEVVHTADDEDQTKSVAYGNLVGVLIEAIKDLNQKVEALEAKCSE